MTEEVNQKDYGCQRSHDVAAWQRDPKSICWKDRDMEYHAAVEAYNKKLTKVYGVNLNLVSSEAMRPYMDLLPPTEEELDEAETSDRNKYSKLKRRQAKRTRPEARKLRREALKLIVSTIKSNKNPFSGEEFGYTGLTAEVVDHIIQFCRTGEPYPRRCKRTVYYTRENLTKFEYMFSIFREYAMRSPTNQVSVEDVDYMYSTLIARKANVLLGVKSHQEQFYANPGDSKTAQEA